MPDSNLQRLIDAAQLLRPLLHELVFVELPDRVGRLSRAARAL